MFALRSVHPGRLPKRTVKTIHRVLVTLLVAAAPTAPVRAQAVEPPFRDPKLSVEQRVEDLLGRLTVEEKIKQTMMDSPEISRLGIPKFHWWNEALHGVARNGTATVFPQAIGLAATWNTPLMHQVADAISTEARAKHNDLLAKNPGGGSAIYQGLTIWSPNINIFRDPRWGRGQETYGEDPFLTGSMGVAFVRGLQGDDPKHLKTVATLKHYAVHSGPENLRHKFDAVASERDLYETYLPAFEMGVREGKATSVMSAYNAINGVPAPANTLLLQDILRARWGFAGAVVGDVDTVGDLYNENGHKFSKDAAEASAVAIKSGNDLCSGTTYNALPEALKRGLVTEADIDVALRRLFALRFRLGEFDPRDSISYARIPASENDSPAHQQLAIEAARQSLVLLKNDGVLPWKADAVRTVAVIGPTADDRSALLGNYSGFPSSYVTLIDAFRARLEPKGVRVINEFGAPLAKGFREESSLFPPGSIFVDASRKQAGFRRELMAGGSFEGQPTSTTVDAQVDLRWSTYYPLPNIPVSFATLRWTGVIVPPVTGDYTLTITGSNAFQLYLEERLVIDGSQSGSERVLSAKVPLTAGNAQSVRLEYKQAKMGGVVRLGWKTPGGDNALERALAAAREADQVVLALGLTPDLEGEEMRVNAEGFAGGDRTRILLPASQRELLEKVSALGKPVTVVLTTGSAVSFDTSKANAILCAWYYGQGGAQAVVEALYGDVNPAGRLPITFYHSEADLPPFDSYAMAGRTYRYFTGKPLFPFGHGLSYTTFAYREARVAVSTVKAEDTVTFEAVVENTGDRDGDEVVQVYARAVKPPVTRAEQWLVGFQRVSLKAGEKRTVSFSVPVARLRRWDDIGHRYVVDPGAYELRSGPSSAVLPVQAKLTVSAQ